MKSVLFVCHGNICRSPMAEFVFKKLLLEAGISDCAVASRATSTEEIWGAVGNPIYPPARDMLRRKGVPFDSAKRAEQLSQADCQTYDLLVGMDDNNMRNMRRMYPAYQSKMVKLLDFAEGGNVADPWYTEDFEQAYLDILRGCKALLAELLQ